MRNANEMHSTYSKFVVLNLLFFDKHQKYNDYTTSLNCKTPNQTLDLLTLLSYKISYMNNTGVKINAATYKELVLEPILEDLGEKMFNIQPFVFQQDGAPAHTARTTQQWLQNNIPHFISKEEWPPSSPDLNPLDFSLWSILESNTCAKCHKNIESLKKSLTEEWAKIPQQTMRTAVRSVPKRLRAVVKNLGGYIE